MATILQTPKHAVNRLNLEASVFYNQYAPHKFEFAVVVNLGAGSPAEILTILAKSVKLGAVTFQTQVVNEYNRKRVVYTGLEYGDTAIEFHDSADGQIISFWDQYFSHYFADPAGGYGLIPTTDESDRYYIESIDVYQFHGPGVNKTTLHNPMIVSWTPGTSDYADSELLDATMVVKPDRISYETNSALPGVVKSFLARGTPDVDTGSAAPGSPSAVGGQGGSGSAQKTTSAKQQQNSDNARQIAADAALKKTKALENANFKTTASVPVSKEPASSSALDSKGGLGSKTKTVPAPKPNPPVKNTPAPKVAPTVAKGKTQGGKNGS